MVAAPLSADELLAQADLAGEAVVMSSTGAHATLRFTRLSKGRLRGRGLLARLGLRREARVRLRGLAGAFTEDGAFVPFLGSWSDEDAYRPGSRIRTYLVFDADAGVYLTLWWNAVTRLR